MGKVMLLKIKGDAVIFDKAKANSKIYNFCGFFLYFVRQAIELFQ